MEENYKYLDEERIKLWNALRELEKKLDQFMMDTPLSLKSEARGALNKASEYCNRIHDRNLEADKIVEEISEKLIPYKEKIENLDKQYEDISKKHQDAQKHIDLIDNKYTHVITEEDKWDNTIIRLEQYKQDGQQWLQNVETIKEKINDYQNQCEDLLNKINNLFAQSHEKKKEIIAVYDEIFGYDIDSQNSEEKIHEDGLKKQLENAYDQLGQKLKNFNANLDDFKAQKENDYDQFLNLKKEEHESITQKIKDLLPDALTAGLSAAYAEQCTNEKNEQQKSYKVFYFAIFIMTSLAIIPVILSGILYFNYNRTLIDIIKHIPYFTCMMLPLYLPVFWVAWSSSRKINLSKRLIEEYAHKVALSKTFQGLEEQISNLDNNATAVDLKVRLLYNLVNISAENPGKLIPHYDTTDNPIMDFLNKSLSLSDSLEKLKTIPGFEKIIERVIESKREKREEIANQSIEETKDC